VSVWSAGRYGYITEVIVAFLLLAAPVVAALLMWGAWGWVAVAIVVAAVEYATLQRSQRFSARFWRSVGVTRRSTRERGIEIIYMISAVAGVVLLVGSLLGLDRSVSQDPVRHGHAGATGSAAVASFLGPEGR
jgi:hypothetical protein